MQKDLSYNYENISLKDYKPMDNFLSNENDITLYSIYRFVNDLKKITKVNYEISVIYFAIDPKEYKKAGEILRQINVNIFLEEKNNAKKEKIEETINSIQAKYGKLLFKMYDNDFVIVHVVNNMHGIYKNYDKRQNYRDYEHNSKDLITINKSNFKDEVIKFNVDEEIDRITGKVYKTNMTQILDLFYKLLEENKIESIRI